MRITKVFIRNYKSISKLEFQPNPGINVFIGENSVGKSNIFDAMNWLLGPTYPSFNATQEQDHYLGNPDNQIKIKLDYDNNTYLELAEQWEDSYHHIKKGLNCSGNYVNDELRQDYASAYLGINRKILDYLPSNRWSLLGRLLLEINKRFKEETIRHNGEEISKADLFREKLVGIRNDFLFNVKDEDGNDIMKEFIDTLKVESAKQLNKEENEFIVDLNLYDPWNFYRTLQLLIKEPDIDLEFQASNLGMGVQASISIAVLKAYANLKLKNNTPIFIDEPELFLHPQAQRNFYNILEELSSNGTQIFITTHSPDFINTGRFDEIFLVRKNRERGTYLNYANPENFITDLFLRKNITTTAQKLMLHYKNAYENTGDTQKANEAFFARKVILVEGESEALVIPYLFSLLEFDYIRECITIVRCGGKNEIDRFYRLYSEFGIPSYVIFDGDKHLDNTQEKDENIEKNKSILSLFDISNDYPDNTVQDFYLGFEFYLERNLGFETSQKGLKLYKQVKEHITSKEQVPNWVQQLIDKIKALPTTSNSILITE